MARTEYSRLVTRQADLLKLIDSTKVRLEEQRLLDSEWEKTKKSELQKAESILSDAKKALETYKDTLKSLEGTASKYSEKTEEDLLQNKRAAILAYDAAKIEYNTANRQLDELATEIEKSKKEITLLERSLLGVETECPTCATPLPKAKVDKAKKEVQARIDAEKKTYGIMR